MLELKNITKIYNQGSVTESCLFQNFDLRVADGEFVSIVGSNGSGKTSMLNIICGSIPVEGGQVVIDGHDITRSPDHRRYARIGRIFQNPAMGTCPDLTMLEKDLFSVDPRRIHEVKIEMTMMNGKITYER